MGKVWEAKLRGDAGHRGREIHKVCLAGPTVAIFGLTRSVFAVDLATGKTLWRYVLFF